MRQELAAERKTGLPPALALELQKLHETDAETRRQIADILLRVAANSKHYSELAQYVATLDISLDTKLLTEARDDIKELKRKSDARDLADKEERENQRIRTRDIEVGIVLLLASAVGTGVVAFIRWVKYDPRRRRALVAEKGKEDAALIAEILRHLESAKNEVIEKQVAGVKEVEAMLPKRRAVRAQTMGTNA